MSYELDEVACDACGAPTERLDPPQETELCFACWQKARAAEEARTKVHIDAYLDRQEAPKGV